MERLSEASSRMLLQMEMCVGFVQTETFHLVPLSNNLVISYEVMTSPSASAARVYVFTADV